MGPHGNRGKTLTTSHVGQPRSPRAFTFVELLIVVGVLAALTGIVLPTISRARRTANTVECASKLRQIAAAMGLYAQQNHDFIPGSPLTSGYFLTAAPWGRFDRDNCPELCQTWDWTAPIASAMGRPFERGGRLDQRRARFDCLCNLQDFRCPDNDIVVAPFESSEVLITTRMVSYFTASLFLYRYPRAPDDLLYAYSEGWVAMSGYVPKVGRVGAQDRKIYIADGARWVNSESSVPTYNLGWNGSGASPGGYYADFGPWSRYSRSYIPGLPYVYSMRHGTRVPHRPSTEYRLNAAFFDGHVETLTGKQALDPRLWMPRGAVVPRSELATEAAALYFASTGDKTPEGPGMRVD